MKRVKHNNFYVKCDINYVVSHSTLIVNVRSVKFKVYSLLLQRRMAQSRLEKIGTIFSRLQGLRKSGAIKSEQVLRASHSSRCT